MTAAEKILKKALVGSSLNSREWNLVQAGLRDRAFFSSQVESARILHAARSMVADRAGGNLSASEIRRDLREIISSTGYRPPEGKEGTLQDLYSKRRLDTIIRTNVDQARGYVRHLDGMKPGAFAAFPGQELVRVRERRAKRDWATRWKNAGGQFYNGRMIALRNDPIWERISVFGNPFPPFDWGSGMGVRAVSRRDCIALGIVTDEEVREKVQALKANENTTPGLNDNLLAEVPFKGNTPEMKRLKDAFGDQITHEDGKIVWRGSAVREAFNSGKPFEIRLGKPTEHLKSMLPAGAEKYLKDKCFTVDGSWLDEPRSNGGSHRDHFEPKEKDPRNIPLTDGDLELIPTLWRKPDSVEDGGYKGSVVCSLETFDGGILRMVVDMLRVPRIKTLYKNKPGIGSGGPT